MIKEKSLLYLKNKWTTFFITTIYDKFLLVVWKLLAPLQIRGKRRLSQI